MLVFQNFVPEILSAFFLNFVLFYQKKMVQNEAKQNKIIEHQLTIDEVCDKHCTSIDTGLNERDVIHRLERDGPNTFTPPKCTPWYVLFLKELTGGFALLLWFSGIASFISYAIERKIEDVNFVFKILSCLSIGIFCRFISVVFWCSPSWPPVCSPIINKQAAPKCSNHFRK